MTERTLASIRPRVSELLQRAAMPGVVIAVARDGHSIECLAVGTDAQGHALAPDGLFPVASITKLVTALSVLRLVDQGAVDYEERLDAYLPESVAAQAGVTLRMLFTHTSGLQGMEDYEATWTPELTWAVEREAASRLREGQIPADHQPHFAKGRLEDRQLKAGAEGHALFTLEVDLAVVTNDLTLVVDEDGGVVEDRLHALLDDHAKGNVGIELTGALRHDIDAWPRNPLGQFGKAHADFIAGGDEFGEDNEVYLLAAGDFVNDVRHTGQVLLDGP